MPSITQLEYLIALDKHRHFGRAAKECHVSQPSLSAQLQKLEDELGVVVFDRSKKPILVTHKGEQVLEQARTIVKEHRRLYDVARESGQLKGELNLAIIPTLAPYIIPIFVQEFSSKYPEVRLKINEYKTEDIIRLLCDDYLDAALLVTPLYDDRIIERSLFYETFHLYVNSDHPLYKRKKIKESDIDSHDIWLLSEGHCFRDQMLKICSMSDQAKPLENVEFESGNLETLINIVRTSRGHTLLPYLATFYLNQHEKKNNLKDFSQNIPVREVSLIHSRSFLKEDIIDALEQTILDNLPEGLSTLKQKKFSIIDI